MNGEWVVYNQRRSASASFGGVHKNRKPNPGTRWSAGRSGAAGRMKLGNYPGKDTHYRYI